MLTIERQTHLLLSMDALQRCGCADCKQTLHRLAQGLTKEYDCCGYDGVCCSSEGKPTFEVGDLVEMPSGRTGFIYGLDRDGSYVVKLLGDEVYTYPSDYATRYLKPLGKKVVDG